MFLHYVDNILVASDNDKSLKVFVAKLTTWFEAEAKLVVDWYLQTHLSQDKYGNIMLDQTQYAKGLVKRFLPTHPEEVLHSDLKKYASPMKWDVKLSHEDNSKSKEEVKALKDEYGFKYLALIGCFNWLLYTCYEELYPMQNYVNSWISQAGLISKPQLIYYTISIVTHQSHWCSITPLNPHQLRPRSWTNSKASGTNTIPPLLSLLTACTQALTKESPQHVICWWYKEVWSNIPHGFQIPCLGQIQKQLLFRCDHEDLVDNEGVCAPLHEQLMWYTNRTYFGGQQCRHCNEYFRPTNETNLPCGESLLVWKAGNTRRKGSLCQGQWQNTTSRWSWNQEPTSCRILTLHLPIRSSRLLVKRGLLQYLKVLVGFIPHQCAWH